MTDDCTIYIDDAWRQKARDAIEEAAIAQRRQDDLNSHFRHLGPSPDGVEMVRGNWQDAVQWLADLPDDQAIKAIETCPTTVLGVIRAAAATLEAADRELDRQ